jgi:RNA polymerase sigma-70 factor (ECF subfamily)
MVAEGAGILASSLISIKFQPVQDKAFQMGSLRSVRSPSLVPEPERNCLDTFAREVDYLYGTLQRLGAPSADIDDLLQDIFVVLHRHWPTLDLTRPLRPWLFGVAFRVVRAQRRRRAREAPLGGLDPEDTAPSPEGQLEGEESLVILRAALERVPSARRSVLVKHDLEGLEVIDIARQLSMTKFGVYARLYKGRKELASAVRQLLREGVRT